MNYWQLPRIRTGSIAIWHRNVLVWKRLLGPAMVFNFGEPTLYLLGLGFGLGMFIGEMGNMPYIHFLASGIVASSAMTTASFEGMYSVYTRMVPQRTYEAIMTTPLDIDDILAGEMLWCASKAVISAAAILIVALFLGVVHDWMAILVLPVVFLVGLCFAAPAIFVSSLATNYDFFNYYQILFITPMFIICDVFYPIETLPAIMQSIVQFLPLTHAVALTRPLITGAPLTQPLLHIGVLLLYTIISYYLAVVMVRRKLLV